MLGRVIDEFNCSHQADIDSETVVEIISREKEMEFISNFITKNMIEEKSRLLYLCGHPGTGKTSTLNLVLSQIKKRP